MKKKNFRENNFLNKEIKPLLSPKNVNIFREFDGTGYVKTGMVICFN